jgi:hypothetical protein
MAKTQKERNDASKAKDAERGAEDLRLKTYPGTAAALATLMKRHGIEQKGEAMSLMLINLTAMPAELSAPAFAVPRHEIEVSESVARAITHEGRKEARRLDRLE